MLTGELHAVNKKLSVEEKQRKTIENELVRLKTVVPENDHDFEVSFTVQFIMVYVYIYTERVREIHKPVMSDSEAWRGRSCSL